jgi:hypothetical protein
MCVDEEEVVVAFALVVVCVEVKLAHFSSVKMQYDSYLHGLQSIPTEGFHLWKSSGEIPNMERIDSQVSEPALLNRCLQVEMVSGSH